MLLLVAFCLTLSALAQSDGRCPTKTPAARQAAPEASYSGKADPRAVILFGNARFTVLTPQLIRMEWAADGHFEDRPSLLFLNRCLPVPTYTTKKDGKNLTVETSMLRLRYTRSGDGKFDSHDLAITLIDFPSPDGTPVTWTPGLPDLGNLKGTVRTLDGVQGSKIGRAHV